MLSQEKQAAYQAMQKVEDHSSLASRIRRCGSACWNFLLCLPKSDHPTLPSPIPKARPVFNNYSKPYEANAANYPQPVTGPSIKSTTHQSKSRKTSSAVDPRARSAQQPQQQQQQQHQIRMKCRTPPHKPPTGEEGLKRQILKIDQATRNEIKKLRQDNPSLSDEDIERHKSAFERALHEEIDNLIREEIERRTSAALGAVLRQHEGGLALPDLHAHRTRIARQMRLEHDRLRAKEGERRLLAFSLSRDDAITPDSLAEVLAVFDRAVAHGTPYVICGRAAMACWGFSAKPLSHVSVLVPSYSKDTLLSWVRASGSCDVFTSRPDLIGVRTPHDGALRRVRVKFVNTATWDAINPIGIPLFRAATQVGRYGADFVNSSADDGFVCPPVLPLSGILNFACHAYGRTSSEAARRGITSDIVWILKRIARSAAYERGAGPLRVEDIPFTLANEFWRDFIANHPAAYQLFVNAGIPREFLPGLERNYSGSSGSGRGGSGNTPAGYYGWTTATTTTTSNSKNFGYANKYSDRLTAAESIVGRTSSDPSHIRKQAAQSFRSRGTTQSLRR